MIVLGEREVHGDRLRAGAHLDGHAVVAQQQDGYIDNLYDGGQLMSNDHVFGRVRLLAQPSEALELDFTVDFRRQDNDTLFLEPDAS